MIGTTVKDDAFYTSHWGWDNWFDYESGYGTDQVCADVIFARDKTTGALAWSRQEWSGARMSASPSAAGTFSSSSRAIPRCPPASPAG